MRTSSTASETDAEARTFASILPEPIYDDASRNNEDVLRECGPDPFGYVGTAVCNTVTQQFEESIANRRLWHSSKRSCPSCSWMVSMAQGVLRFLSAKPRVIGWNCEDCNMKHEKEEMGAVTAAGMTKSWRKPELIACYVL